ncbi:MAG: C40 family peptidase [Methylococcales bacterium]|nr:C40 family peptidase [Methylococcales bacterium]
MASLTLSGRLSAEPASVSSIAPEDLVEFGIQTPDMKKLIRSALSLTKKNLRYTFGSNSPSRGGTDCSGAVQFTLSEMGLTKVPRTSFDFYQWVKTSSKINPARKIYDISNPAFAQLKPGDLLFWEGTYNAAKNNPPVSHVMIYLGTLKADNRGVMFGSSSGRRYRGKKIHGVSVFDFKIPSKSSSAKFIGYGAVPGLSNKREEPITAAEKKKKNKVSFLEWLGFKKKKIDSVSLGESKPVATPVLNETPQGLKKEQSKTE